MPHVETPTARELVDAAKARVGAETQSDLVYELRRRYGFRTDQSQVSRWTSRTGPSYDATMALLRAAGWLSLGGDREDATAAGRAVARFEAALVALEAAAAQVRETLPSTPRRAAK